MNLLTDKEIAAICAKETGFEIEGYELTDYAILDFARGIESAILAKLASAELPEPVCMAPDYELDYMRTHDAGAVYAVGSQGALNNDADIALYTADQLRQAYAQGAAAQLSAEPIGEFEALPDPTVGELPWLNIYDAKSRVVGTKLYTRRQAND